MTADLTLEEFASHTPEERAAYLAKCDASTARRSLALSQLCPVAAAPAAVSIDVRAIVTTAMASARKPPVAPRAPADPIAEAEALAHAVVTSAALASGTKPPSFEPLLAAVMDAPASPNAEAEALAASIVASANLAAGEQAGAPSDAEALAREIVASSALAAGEPARIEAAQ